MGGVIVDSAVYRQGQRIVDDLPPSELGRVRKLACEPGDFVWVGLHEPTEHELATVEEEFGLHPLAVEDAFNAHQRPKLERYGETLFLTLKSLWYVDATDAVETGEINMFVGDDFIITVRHGSGSELHSARRDLEARAKVLTHGPSAVVYAVCDRVVDGYLAVMSCLEEDVDEVETSVFSTQRTSDSARIYTLKREIAEARRAVLPLREPMRRFATGAVPGIDEDAAPFFRDVLDHLTQVSETVDGLDAAAVHRVRGAPRADPGDAERGHAQDLGGSRPRGRADPDRRRLRHELPPHARARLAARLPHGARTDGAERRRALGLLQALRVALTRWTVRWRSMTLPARSASSTTPRATR